MSKDFIKNSILQSTADAIRYCDKTTNSIAPKDYADRIRELDKLIPQPDVLNFYMPNGGTISLNKQGSPYVVELEYWLDENGMWLIWQPDVDGNRSLVLTAGQKVYVRNRSVTSTGFSKNGNNRYQFRFSDTVYADGEINSLVCKNPDNAVILYCIFYGLFLDCTQLITAPKLSSTTTAYGCYCYMFRLCSNLISSFELKATKIESLAYYGILSNCTLVNNIKVYMTDISAQDCITNWLSGVAVTGDFYCPAELTIPTGNSGIPSGWTRHDI